MNGAAERAPWSLALGGPSSSDAVGLRLDRNFDQRADDYGRTQRTTLRRALPLLFRGRP